MIKCNKGEVQITGITLDIAAEYACLTHALKQVFVDGGMKEAEADNLLTRSMKDGLMSDDEIDKAIDEVKEARKKVDDIEKEIKELMEKLWKGEG